MQLPYAIHGADELLVGVDGAAGHQVENEGDSRKDSRPCGTEGNSAPRLVANSLANHEVADIPAHDE